MKSKLIFLIVVGNFILISGKSAGSTNDIILDSNNNVACSDTTIKAALEPFTYTEDFESRDLGAWASYPLWQDNAYDQNFQVGEIVPGDSNLSIVAKITPYSHEDDFVGAQKLLDMYLVPGA